MIVQTGAKSVRTTDAAAKVLFLMVEVARQNFPGNVAQQRTAVTQAFCALEGKIRANAEDRKVIAREMCR